MKTITIKEDDRQGIMDKLEPLRKRAEKYGLAFPTITFGEPFLKKVMVQDISSLDNVTPIGKPYPVFYLMVEMHLEGEGIDKPISHGDYQVIGSFNHEYSKAVCNDFTGLVDVAYRERFKEKNRSHCEHCGKSIYRHNTYIVQNPEGKQIAVGSSCMKTYVPLGRTVEEIVQFYGMLCSTFSGMDDENPRSGPHYEHTETVLFAHTAVYMMKIGDVKSEIFEQTVFAMLNNYRELSSNTRQWLKENQLEIQSNVNTIVEYWKTFSPRNDFEEKLCIIVPSPYLRQKDSNVVKWGVYNYFRAQGIKSVEEQMSGVPDRNEYVVPVGEVLEIEEVVVVANRLLYSGVYGDTYLLVFKTKDGCTITWKTSYREVEIGEKLGVKGRCKDHVEYNGVHQTEITRAKIWVCEQ